MNNLGWRGPGSARLSSKRPPGRDAPTSGSNGKKTGMSESIFQSLERSGMLLSGTQLQSILNDPKKSTDEIANNSVLDTGGVLRPTIVLGESDNKTDSVSKPSNELFDGTEGLGAAPVNRPILRKYDFDLSMFSDPPMFIGYREPGMGSVFEDSVKLVPSQEGIESNKVLIRNQAPGSSYPKTVDLNDYMTSLLREYTEAPNGNTIEIDESLVSREYQIPHINLSPLSKYYKHLHPVKKEIITPAMIKERRTKKRKNKIEELRKQEIMEKAGVKVEKPPSNSDIPKGCFGTGLELKLNEIHKKRFEFREAMNAKRHNEAVKLRESVDQLKSSIDEADKTGACFTVVRARISGDKETKLRNKYFELLKLVGKEKALTGFVMLLGERNYESDTEIVALLTGNQKQITKYIKHIGVSLEKHQAILDTCSHGVVNRMIDTSSFDNPHIESDDKQILKLYESDEKKLIKALGVVCYSALRSSRYSFGLV